MRPAASLPLLALALGCGPVSADRDPTPDTPAPQTDDDDDTPADWDFGPPDLPAGTVMVGILTCGMLRGSADIYYEFDGEAWASTERVEHDFFETLDELGEPIHDGSPWPEVESCFRRGEDRSLDWSEDGRLRFYNGQWLHDLMPTATESHWLGGVSPTFDDLPDSCTEGMAALGVEIPVTLSLGVMGYVE